MKLAALIIGLLGLSAMELMAAEKSAPARPNVLVIIVDQQHARMLSCAGNPWVKTPNMDKLAASGARFERAYCADPVCVPSRFSMLTGVLPSRIGMETNEDLRKCKPTPQLLESAMGRLFAAAGYETAYGGKQHFPMTIQQAGFTDIESNQGAKLASTCVNFLHQKHEKPFLLVASFINPHDICFMAIRDEKTPGKINGPELLVKALETPKDLSKDDFFAKVCPPLPDNYAIPAGEPQSILAADMRLFRTYARTHWSDQQWRLHRWAYARLTEEVDAQIGMVLTALHDSGLEKNTLVVFTSDHGDMDASHHLEHKSVLYEEATNVPLVVSWNGVTKPGLVDREHLISTGLDLIPTLCDFAGVNIPAGLKGHSLRPLAEGQLSASWRQTVVVENGKSRLLRSAHYKYSVYATGAPREMLTDVTTDPGEMKNLALDPVFAPVLVEHRRLLKEWYDQNGETLHSQYSIAEK